MCLQITKIQRQSCDVHVQVVIIESADKDERVVKGRSV
jgi:hypothetical protein